MKELEVLNKYLLKYKYRLLLGALFVTFSNMFSIMPAQIVRHALDLITENVHVQQLFEGSSLATMTSEGFYYNLLLYAGLLLLMALCKGFFLYLTRQTIIVMSRLIEFDLKNEIYEHYQVLPLSFYRSNNTGDLMARISEDVSKVRMYLGPAIMYGINLLVLFVLVITQMFSINARLAFFTLLPLPFLSVSIYYVSNRINIQSERIQKSLSGLSTFVQEAFSGIRVLKSFVREENSVDQFDKESANYREESLKLSKINALFFPLIVGLIGLSTILTIYIGGSEVIAGKLSVGNIAEFVIYVNLMTWPVASLGWVSSIIQRAAASQKRINEFLHTKSDINSGSQAVELEGDISFENVSLVYPDSGIKAVDGISFSVKQGESLAIVGGTGSGKSSIANLLCRMYDPTDGAIKFGGLNAKEFQLPKLRGQIGYVPQDSFLFSDSIRNNVAFGSETATEEDILQATEDAFVKHNIEAFPEGFDTMLGERGVTLSGGQRQRVTLARALVRNPKVLVLDDCLSAVDTKTEDKILGNLTRIMEGRTSVIISHRVSSVKLADRIIVLDDGRIVEEGTHEELLSRTGVYKQLYDAQLEENE